ncbi:uncharacterized histidine-rich protein DDB_G0274557-like [Varroa destructor]|uniref:Uncharacterized protein n=1 Tax=Varroa destructor TaxID=109461 RepID=A0A7M7JVR9_VARDE|nr:uncharacterized histidine-rich protein DDB_G0274557-like [Varroa destructor]
MKQEMSSLRRVVFVAVLAALAFHHPASGFRLKKLARATLLGAAVAPRFVPIPIPHHVHAHHGHHGHHHVKEHHIHVPLHHHNEHHYQVVHHDHGHHEEHHGHGWDHRHGGW